ncbi:DUF4276 family protein [Anabaena subtropica]|uniref:DUF4276 family protein n=1 Tax=Anabaena subtropica FACHB-260 TaxID=2692884 RepID=A0ABR8CSQ1_9NOST|nr:DUF4276 family protein [Anabaena subtropica]MBD2345821.1 DUF4276 family protein [Anabaena subtropica FACHB-260]
MVKEVRIYVEGGGDGKNQKALIRQGFNQFFRPLVELARSKKVKWSIIICGTRNNAFRDFKNALQDHPDAFNVLLVDAEASVKVESPWQHLKFRDNWDKPSGVDNSQCHLMVQAMEAWLIADMEMLKKFYGKGFKENAISTNSNVETIAKDSLEPSLKDATRNTTKGEYQKIKHASKLLELLDVSKVRQASPYCDRLFMTLQEIMEP